MSTPERVLRAGVFEIPEEEIEVRFSRSSGPGGQNVNKRATRVELLFDVAGSRALDDEEKELLLRRLAPRLDSRGRVRVSSQSGRTQLDNRERALGRLAALLTEATTPPPAPRRATKPTRTARERRLEEKRVRATVKRLRSRPERED